MNDNNSDIDTTKTLGEYVSIVLKNYFNNLDGQRTTDLYNMVLSEVERPLLETVLTHTNRNQTTTANILGLSRGTLRKKMQQYNLLD
ncbi:MAG: DNA-binding transcriptional regulator Fis [Gammaproteobacteria bacterium]|nr:DNA-binding transcriptional regulator Fis [Gammaproteobacteria bacterium]